jgi:hypothetical protein
MVCRDLYIDLPAGRELHALAGAGRGFRQGDGQRGRDVLTAAAGQILLLELSTDACPAAAGPSAAECFLQDIFEAPKAAKATARAAARTPKAVASPGERFELAVLARARTAPGAEPFKALKTRLSFGIDFAAIEGLAFGRFAQNFVSGVQLGKSRRRLRVVLVRVRVQLLGLPPESALDLRGARVLRYPQGVVGVTHPQCLPGASLLVMPGRCPNRMA